MLKTKQRVLKKTPRPLPSKALQINIIKSKKAAAIKSFIFGLVIYLYLFVSPISTVNANFDEKVIPPTESTVSSISSQVISEKVPSFLAPVHGYISTRFTRFHPGIDIPNPLGSPTAAAFGGEVIFAGFMTNGYGNLVILKHGLGFESFYAHLSEIKVAVGQRVIKGQEIGKVGSTGNSTGFHLHFELHQNGNPTNPLNYIIP